VLVLNGPNLQRLGTPEPDVYGVVDPAEVANALGAATADGLEVDLRWTDDEAELIGWLREAVDTDSPVILNPAAFAHYSYALHEAVRLVTAGGLPVVEVHVTNPAAREAFRGESVIAPVATGVVAGLGVDGYRLALAWVGRRVRAEGVGEHPRAAG
jgi:3-dehydroquinate dehydratase-2